MSRVSKIFQRSQGGDTKTPQEEEGMHVSLTREGYRHLVGVWLTWEAFTWEHAALNFALVLLFSGSCQLPLKKL